MSSNGQGPPEEVPGQADPFENVPMGIPDDVGVGEERQRRDPRIDRYRKIEVVTVDRDGPGKIIEWRTVE